MSYQETGIKCNISICNAQYNNNACYLMTSVNCVFFNFIEYSYGKMVAWKSIILQGMMEESTRALQKIIGGKLIALGLW